MEKDAYLSKRKKKKKNGKNSSGGKEVKEKGYREEDIDDITREQEKGKVFLTGSQAVFLNLSLIALGIHLGVIASEKKK